VLVIFLLGGAAATGLLSGVTWREVLLAALVLVVIRPVASLVALAGSRAGPRERGAIAVFGVRGVGSVFYVAYGLQAGDFAEADQVWRVVALVVIGSIVLHGVSATPVMRRLDRLRGERDHAAE
jgi:NhaP-type Na+/H+ or K+/H+ antiporter